MQKVKYDIDKIRFSTDTGIFERAVALFESGKIKKFMEDEYGFSALVSGTHDYEVSVSKKNFDRGSCNCYLGKNYILCKHMVAVAVCGVLDGKKLSKSQKEVPKGPASSGKKGTLTKEELSEIKKLISSALKYIRSYTGPSRIWFSYQASLSEGCARLSEIVSSLPLSRQSAELLKEHIKPPLNTNTPAFKQG